MNQNVHSFWAGAIGFQEMPQGKVTGFAVEHSLVLNEGVYSRLIKHMPALNDLRGEVRAQ